MKNYQPFSIVGVIFIATGILLVILPFIAEHLPGLEEIPWIIIWTYKSDNFVFVTSPALIIITVISFILFYLKH
ncbi:MAG: hypothetical protein NWE80_03845 [Candidatus Bathyarchaeota archaeon]|nr:hypothetical protein [Candidatus Bathyarchaeota archaeon]